MEPKHMEVEIKTSTKNGLLSVALIRESKKTRIGSRMPWSPEAETRGYWTTQSKSVVLNGNVYCVIGDDHSFTVIIYISATPVLLFY